MNNIRLIMNGTIVYAANRSFTTLLDYWEADGTQGFLIDDPSNQDINDPEFPRIRSFEEFLEGVKLDYSLWDFPENPQKTIEGESKAPEVRDVILEADRARISEKALYDA